MIKSLAISIHIPKCAGTSFQQALASSVGDDLFLDYGNLITNLSDNATKKRLIKKRQVINEILGNKFNYKIVHGHFYSTKWLDIVENPSWITVLRHPAELVKSYYNFLTNKESDGPLVKLAKEMNSLEEFAEHSWFRNIMTRQLKPLKIEDFSIISTMERYDDFLTETSSFLGVGIKNVKKNVSNKTSLPMTKEQISIIENNNGMDMELYNYVSQKGGLIVNK